MRKSLFTAVMLAFAGPLGALSIATALEIPAAIHTDPMPDLAHPARMDVLHIPSHGETINGIAYIAAGAGEHPAVVLLHGLTWQRRQISTWPRPFAGPAWTARHFNYRGRGQSWGCFRFEHTLQDATPCRLPARSRHGERPWAWIPAPGDHGDSMGGCGGGEHGGARQGTDGLVTSPPGTR